MQTIPNFDATFCGKLPPHQTNLIQPHGVLFVLDRQRLEIIQVSDNLSSLTGQEPASVIGKPLVDLLCSAEHTLHQFRDQAFADRQPLQLSVQTSNGPTTCSALAHAKGNLLYVEILLPGLVAGASRSFLDVYQQIRNFLQAVSGKEDINEFAAAVAKQTQLVSGFDKVMVYSFNAEWHGTVIAEEKQPDQPAYLGLRFPASDIPKPVRDLYLKNPYRFIPNSAYQPARLYPLLHPQTRGFTDLSDCNLRSVAAVHLEYLKNMEVSASLSLRLVHEGKLWGLVSCHHRDAMYFSYETLGFLELLSEIISAQLSIVLNNGVAAKRQALQSSLTALVPALHDADSLEEALTSHAPAIQAMLGAGGLAFQYNGFIHTTGNVPESADLKALLYWLEVQLPEQIVHHASLPQAFEEAAAFADVGSGLLALPIVPEKGAFLVAFRPETIMEVAWGGNPHEALQFEADGKAYHPRNSFNIWKQTTRQTARPWTTEELEIAEALQLILTRLALRSVHA